MGSKPHSKGEAFSRVFRSLREMIVFRIKRSVAIRRNNIDIIIIKNIIYIKD